MIQKETYVSLIVLLHDHCDFTKKVIFLWVLLPPKFQSNEIIHIFNIMIFCCIKKIQTNKKIY